MPPKSHDNLEAYRFGCSNPEAVYMCKVTVKVTAPLPELPPQETRYDLAKKSSGELG